MRTLRAHGLGGVEMTLAVTGIACVLFGQVEPLAWIAENEYVHRGWFGVACRLRTGPSGS
jgi:hypothetical protein